MNWNSITEFFRSNVLRWMINFLLLPAATASGTAYAQGTWQIDPANSIATVSLGDKGDSLQIGLARVSGQVLFEAKDPANTTVTFRVNSDASGAEYTSLSFDSRRCAVTAEGKLIVIGDLSVTRVERDMSTDPSDAYAGPEYGDPTVRTDTRPIALLFSDPRGLASQVGIIRILGTTTVAREDFPQLLDTITTDVWQSRVINAEKCISPSTIGADYHGSECSGTVVASIDNALTSTGASSGEGFYGFVPTATPDRNKATIAFDLSLSQVSESTIASR